MDAALIGAFAALLTAAGGLAAQLKSDKPTGKPWMAGVITLAIVGGVLLIVSLSSGRPSHTTQRPTTTQSADVAATAYTNRVVNVCTEDREVELSFKQQIEHVQEKMVAGDVSAVYTVPKLMTLALVSERGLADTLESLPAPDDLGPVQNEAVVVWRRKIAVSQASRDQLNAAAKRAAGDLQKFAEAYGRLDSSEENRLESQKDVLLRRLGGLGCNPAP